MTTLMSIAAHPSRSDLAALSRLWLCESGIALHVQKCTLHERYWARNTRRVKTCRDASETQAFLQKKRFFLGADALEVDCYAIMGGVTFELTLVFYGVGFSSGRRWKESGQALVWVAKEPFEEAMVDADFMSRSTEFGVATDAWMRLFEYFCGERSPLCERRSHPEGTVVEHASLHLESGWPPPAGSAGVFHRRIGEFAVDYRRMLYSHRLGLPYPLLFCGQSPPPWSGHVPAAEDQHLREYYGQFDSGTGEILAFFEALTIRDVERIEELPVADIQRLFQRCASTVAGVSSFGSEQGGVAFVTTPLSSLWSLYVRVLREVS